MKRFFLLEFFGISKKTKEVSSLTMQKRNGPHGIDIHIDLKLTEVLSTEEQYRLAEIAMAGNEEENKEAREQLVLSMTRLIMKKALQSKVFRGDLLRDAIQECYITLLRIFSPSSGKEDDEARFNPDKDAKPSTYADIWIAATLQRQYDKLTRIIHLPNYLSFRIHKLNTLVSQDENMTGEEIKNLAQELGLSEKCLRNFASVKNIKSLDANFSDTDGSTTLLDLIAGSDGHIDHELIWKRTRQKKVIEEALNILNKREKEIIRGRYGLDGKKLTLRDLSEKYGISRERVRQIEQKAKTELRKWGEEYIRNHQSSPSRKKP